MYDIDQVRYERDSENWGDLSEEEIEAWRLAGFTSSSTKAWLDVLSLYFVSGDEATSWLIRLASAWTVAGFSAELCDGWIEAFFLQEPEQAPMLAREWSTAGFDARLAKPWALRGEDAITASTYRGHGWQVWQRDLLHLLLDDPTLSALGLQPELFGRHEERLFMHILDRSSRADWLLDYVRAGLPIEDWHAFDRMRVEGIDVRPALETYGARLSRSFDRLFRCEWLRPSSSGDTPYYLQPYLVDTVLQTPLRHEPEHPLTDDWERPALICTWAQLDVDVQRCDYGGWQQDGCPEDYAYEPNLDWDEAQRLQLIKAFEAELEPGQSCEVQWPPIANLWTPGLANEPMPEPCGQHDEFEPWCEECTPPRAMTDYDPAEFHWHVDVTTYEAGEDGHPIDLGFDRHHIATTYLHPGSVEYSTAPLR